MPTKIKNKIKELEILNSTEDDIKNMSYKDRQKYFHIKSKYGKIIHQSGTYKKKVNK